MYPKPVTAYAAVSAYGGIDAFTVTEHKDMTVALERSAGLPRREIIPVTLLPTEQYEAMVASLGELVAAMRRYEGDVAGDADQPTEHREMMERANAALAALKEQDHG